MDTPKRAAIYTRISADQTGEGAGVERQLEACEELAARLGWEVVDRFEDPDISAYSGKRRPGFEALLDALKNGQVDALVVWHVDRLYRSLKDLVRLLEVASGAPIKTVNSGELDLSTSAGKMVATILGSVAIQESEHSGERRVLANMKRAEVGHWQAQSRTFGYRTELIDPAKPKGGVVGRPLEPEASAYRQAVTDVLGGISIRSIVIAWNKRGLVTTKGRPWSSPRLRRLLVNPRYAGIVVHKGRVIEGVESAWTPLIDADTHRGLVAYLSDPSRVHNTSFERKRIGTGIYRCGLCGGPMKATVPSGKKRWQYICRDHGHVVRSGEPVDDLVKNAVLERLSLPDAGLRLDTPDGDLAGLQNTRAALVETYDQLSTLLVEGVLDGPTARKNAADLKSKIAAIDSRFADAVRTSPAASLLAAGEQLRARWEAMAPAVKGQVVEEIVAVTILPSPKGLHRFDPAYVDIAWT